MRILLSAVACNPERGSEAHFGWTALLALAKNHELWVICHENDREALDRARANGTLPEDVHLSYASKRPDWHRNRIISRLQSWLDYRRWCHSSLEIGRRLHAEHHFDLVHHVTLSSWRVATPLWKLGIPLVWGPIGGAERFPFRFYSILSLPSMAYELLRSAFNLQARLSPSVRSCARNAAALVASDPETAQLLARLSGRPERVYELSAAFFNESQIQSLRSSPGSTTDSVPLNPAASSQPLPLIRCFAGGDIEGRKGIAMALHGLHQLNKNGVDFIYQIAGQGPESNFLLQLAAKLGIADKVNIGKPLPGDEYRQALMEADIYLLPSLRDSAGLTLMEAMLCGCVPVIAHCGGPGSIVTEECGILLPVTNPHDLVDSMMQSVERLLRDPALKQKLGSSAAERIASFYSEKHYIAMIEGIYQAALGEIERQGPDGVTSG